MAILLVYSFCFLLSSGSIHVRNKRVRFSGPPCISQVIFNDVRHNLSHGSWRLILLICRLKTRLRQLGITLPFRNAKYYMDFIPL